jgi:hypothetical protein
MGPKEAMEITGQVAQLMGKTETERALNNLRDVLLRRVKKLQLNSL